MDPLTGNSTSKQCACRVGGGLPSSRTRFVFSVCRLVSRRCHAISSILGCPARLWVPKTDPPLSLGSCCHSLVMKMQAANVGNYSNFSVFAGLILFSFRCVHFQGLMDAEAVGKIQNIASRSAGGVNR